MTEQEIDKFIKEKLNEDKVISRNADNLFKKNYKGEIEMENKKFNILKYKKALATAACLVVLLGGANVYASTNGYGNIFFLEKYLITGNNEAKENDEVLSDRDITISYENLKITDKITMKIEKLQIKDGKAKLITRVEESEKDTQNVTPFIYKVYDQDEKELTNVTSSKSVGNDILYEDDILIENYNENVKILKLKIYTPNQELLKEIKIDIENKTVEVSENTDELKKISEIELKKYLGKYASLNNYGVILGRTSHATKEEWQNAIKVGIATNLIYEKETSNGVNSEIVYGVDKVNKVIKEFTGENISGKIKLPADGTLYYNEKNKAYEYMPGDGDGYGDALCINIENIKYNNGIYEAKFTYCYPTDSDYDSGEIDKLELYETTMKFKLNKDYTYTKYCLVDIDKIEYKKIKESEFDYEDSTTGTIENTGNLENTKNNMTEQSNTLSKDNKVEQENTSNSSTKKDENTNISNSNKVDENTTSSDDELIGKWNTVKVIDMQSGKSYDNLAQFFGTSYISYGSSLELKKDGSFIDAVSPVVENTQSTEGTYEILRNYYKNGDCYVELKYSDGKTLMIQRVTYDETGNWYLTFNRDNISYELKK